MAIARHASFFPQVRSVAVGQSADTLPQWFQATDFGSNGKFLTDNQIEYIKAVFNQNPALINYWFSQTVGVIFKTFKLKTDPALGMSSPFSYFASLSNLISHIGGGSYGSVLAAQDLDSGQLVAIKYGFSNKPYGLKQSANEMTTLKSYGKFIAGVSGMIDQSSNCYYIAMKLERGVSLNKFFHTHPNLMSPAILELAKNLCCTLYNFHTKTGRMHRDIHQGNFIVNEDLATEIIDFCFASKPDPEKHYTVINKYYCSNRLLAEADSTPVFQAKYTYLDDYYSMLMIIAEKLGFAKRLQVTLAHHNILIDRVELAACNELRNANGVFPNLTVMQSIYSLFKDMMEMIVKEHPYLVGTLNCTSDLAFNPIKQKLDEIYKALSEPLPKPVKIIININEFVKMNGGDKRNIFEITMNVSEVIFVGSYSQREATALFAGVKEEFNTQNLLNKLKQIYYSDSNNPLHVMTDDVLARMIADAAQTNEPVAHVYITKNNIDEGLAARLRKHHIEMSTASDYIAEHNKNPRLVI